MIPVIWHAQKAERGHYNCTQMINDLFDFHKCWHFGYEEQWKYGDLDGAAFVVHGGREQGAIDRLNIDIEELKWVLLIFLGDEEGVFPIEQVEHPNKIVWIQEPRYDDRHGFADRYILDGYTPGCKSWKKREDRPPTIRDLDFVFAGQVTHERRIACVDALRRIPWGGIVVETKGYCQGVSPPEYFHLLERAHLVPCPSGPFSPDAARPWESLECGAIPILDELSPVQNAPGFWKRVLGDHPLPTIVDWNDLPEMIHECRTEFEILAPLAQAWWSRYKANFLQSLPEDVQKLKERAGS